MDLTVIENWGDAVMVAVTDALRSFLGFLPQLIGALLVVILGWIIAGFVAGLVERGLKAVGFERAAQSTGIADFVQRSGSNWTVSHMVAEIVKWFIRLLAIQAAASILGMAQITEIVNSIMLWLPNLVVALVIIVIGALIAGFVAGVVRGATSEMGFSNPDLLSGIARYAIITFAVLAAIDQLGIAETMLNTLFIGAVAMVVLAAGLAFGLGGRETAAQITQGWYRSGQEASRRISQYAERKQADKGRAGSAAEATSSSAKALPAGSRPARPR